MVSIESTELRRICLLAAELGKECPACVGILRQLGIRGVEAWINEARNNGRSLQRPRDLTRRHTEFELPRMPIERKRLAEAY